MNHIQRVRGHGSVCGFTTDGNAYAETYGPLVSLRTGDLKRFR